MYNKEMFEKICNVECSFEELESFVVGIDKKEYDFDDAFEKYYRIESILKAIWRYHNNEVNELYLAYWADAYNWIINSSFNVQRHAVSLKDIVKRDISDWLDSLSFFNEGDVFLKTDYKTAFKMLDYLYQTIDEWEGFYAYEAIDEESFDSAMLFVNHKTKEFTVRYDHVMRFDVKKDIKEVSKKELNEEIMSLRQCGYCKLRSRKFKDKN